MSSAKKLFLVVLGGRCKGCHVEQHDVRWVVGETIDATLPALRKEWIGLRRGLHIDSYRCIDYADGHRIEDVEHAQDVTSADAPHLWFVNLGAYDPTLMAEQHAFGVIDDLLPSQGNGQWHLKLIADPDVGDAPVHPDWYGYWRI